MKHPKSLLEKQLVNILLATGAQLKEEVSGLQPGDTIRILRRRFCMTQRQLAKRSGISQSQIARIERRQDNPGTKTLAKLLKALNCHLLLLPIPHVSPEETLRKQATVYVRQKMDYLKGTLAMEDQLPREEMMKLMETEEIERLLHSESSEIWDAD